MILNWWLQCFSQSVIACCCCHLFVLLPGSFLTLSLLQWLEWSSRMWSASYHWWSRLQYVVVIVAEIVGPKDQQDGCTKVKRNALRLAKWETLHSSTYHPCQPGKFSLSHQWQHRCIKWLWSRLKAGEWQIHQVMPKMQPQLATVNWIYNVRKSDSLVILSLPLIQYIQSHLHNITQHCTLW